jgi:hypothetical protein
MFIVTLAASRGDPLYDVQDQPWSRLSEPVPPEIALLVLTDAETDAALPALKPRDDIAIHELPHATYVIPRRDGVGANRCTVGRERIRGSQCCAPSPESDAVYLLQYALPYLGVYHQELRCPAERPFAQTSCHFHRQQTERWYILHGSGVLRTCHLLCGNGSWIERTVEEGKVYSVTPWTAHQLRTGTVLTACLVMIGDPQGISRADHTYLPPPEQEVIPNTLPR